MSLPVRRDGEGFSDSASFDFADPEGATSGLIRVELRPGARRAVTAGLLLVHGEETELARSDVELEVPADWSSVEVDGLRLTDDGERARLTLEGERALLELEVARLGGAALEAGCAFTEASGLVHEAFSARISGEWRSGASRGRVRSLGRLVRTAGEIDWEQVEVLRSLTATLDDGSLLAVAAARPRGAAGHDEEAANAILLDAGGSVRRLGQPLLSTEYDAAGRHRRAGIELWEPEQAAPLRGAGTRVAGAVLDLGPARMDSAFLRFTLNGEPGTARYELMRAG